MNFGMDEYSWKTVVAVAVVAVVVVDNHIHFHSTLETKKTEMEYCTVVVACCSFGFGNMESWSRKQRMDTHSTVELLETHSNWSDP